MARIEFPSLKTEPVTEPELILRGEQRGTEFTPILLTQLQDDLSRSRLREAFWISVVAHLLGIILLALSPKLLPHFWHPVELRTAEQMIHDKEFTYLELPKDSQRPSAKTPDTKFLSDKNRIARSKMQPPDRQTLESLRKGLPGPPEQPVPSPSTASTPPQAGGMPNQQQASNNAQFSAPATKPQRDLSAFAGMSAGSAIAQAARNSSRGSFSTGGGAITATRTAAAARSAAASTCSAIPGRRFWSLPFAHRGRGANELVQPDSRRGASADAEKRQSRN